MKTTPLLVIALALLAASHASADERKRVAILELEAGPAVKTEAESVPPAIAAQLAQNPGYEVVPVDEVQKAVGTHQHCGKDPACVSQVAEAVHAELVLSGSLKKEGKKFVLHLVATEPGDEEPASANESMNHLTSLTANVKLCLDRLIPQSAPKEAEAAPAPAPAPPPPPEPAHVPKVKAKVRSLALIGVTPGEGFTAKQVKTIEELLLASLDNSGHFKVIGQSDINSLLTLETRKQSLGCTDSDACTTQIAAALGVELLATADIGRLGSTTVISLKVIEVTSAQVVARGQELVEHDDGLAAATRRLSDRVVETLWPGTISPAALLPPVAVQHPAGPRHPWLKRFGWASLIVGGVALATGTGLGINVRKQQSQVKSVIYPGETTASLIKGSNTQAVGADVLFGVGGVAGAAGISLVIFF